jgi:hypothetical protein
MRANCKGVIEILPWEIGKKFKTDKDIFIRWGIHTLSIRSGFPHDGYTFAPNLPDLTPAIAHDFAYVYKRWDSGLPIAKWEADLMLYDLMKQSESRATRWCAWIYYLGVRMAWWNNWIP